MKQPVSAATKEVLVSGAGFAGLATAFWLTRLGYQVTVVEIANGLRRGGTPVDIEGDTIGILERMGLLEAIRAKVLPPRTLEFKSEDDGTIGVMAPAPRTRNTKFTATIFSMCCLPPSRVPSEWCSADLFVSWQTDGTG